MKSLKAAAAMAIFLAGFGLMQPASQANRPTPEMLAAFDRYVAASETRTNEELARKKNFLWIDTLPERARNENCAALKRGQAVVRRFHGCHSRACVDTPGGLIHDWIGIVFVPGVSLAQTLEALQDYDHDAVYYQPQVAKAKLLSRSGNDFRVFLRLKQTNIVTVVFDTEYEIKYTLMDDAHAASQSHSTRIAEVENAGSPQEHVRVPGDDHGFLWRLYSYWRFWQADGGVYIQCNAISLTRDLPAGLDWLIGPFIHNISRDSLRFTLSATRQALLDKYHIGLGN